MEDKIAELFKNPLKVIGLTICISSILSFFVLVAASSDLQTHGAQYHLSPQDAIVAKGQQVYLQEGCQYCHTQNIRPFAWELKRFSDAEALGYVFSPHVMDNYFEAPSLKGSRRIGPDISMSASLYDENQLKRLLRSPKNSAKLKDRLHQYTYLFKQKITDSQSLALSRKMSVMLLFRAPFSDIQQRGVFSGDELSRGDMLIAYLLSRGKRQMQFSSKYYSKR